MRALLEDAEQAIDEVGAAFEDAFESAVESAFGDGRDYGSDYPNLAGNSSSQPYQMSSNTGSRSRHHEYPSRF